MPRYYSFRPATRDDLGFVTRLHHETLREYIEPIHGWDEQKQNEQLARWFKPERVTIVQWSGQDIGLLVVEQKDDSTRLESISLQPGFQGKGLGTQIIRDILEGVHQPVTLQVLRTNPAKRLYERLGFRVTSEDAAHYQMRWEPPV